MATVLVTGGAGYVGSHAAKALRAAGHATVILDDLSAGHREAALGAALVVADIADVDAVRQAIRDYRVDAVMHFAAWLSVGDSVADPAGYYRNNVAGTLSTLSAMASEHCSRFVFSSTCAVYGDATQTPIDERHQTNPINTYGQTKLAIEQALPHFERAYGIRSVRLRYFNAAGADPDGEIGEDHAPEIHIVPRCIAAATGGPTLQVFGEDYPTDDGTCVRDYVHVSDLADAHVRALEYLESGGVSDTFNVGTERPSSVRDVIASVERIAGRPVVKEVGSRRTGDPAVLFASASRIRTSLGWTPRRPDLDTIVADAWRWHTSRPRGFDDRRTP